MPLNAAAESARLSVAPMMDGGDFGSISTSWVMLCASHVLVSIAWSRAASRAMRRVERDRTLYRVTEFVGEHSLMRLHSLALLILLKPGVVFR